MSALRAKDAGCTLDEDARMAVIIVKSGLYRRACRVGVGYVRLVVRGVYVIHRRKFQEREVVGCELDVRGRLYTLTP